jgi:hypothetical protein
MKQDVSEAYCASFFKKKQLNLMEFLDRIALSHWEPQVKVKFALEQAMKTKKESIIIAILFL